MVGLRGGRSWGSLGVIWLVFEGVEVGEALESYGWFLRG